MFELIIIIVIIYIIYSKSKTSAIPNYINTAVRKALEKQQFSNIQNIYSKDNLNLLTANYNKKTYLFAYKNNLSPINANELNIIYTESKEFHISNVVIVCNPHNITSENRKLINDYNFEMWNITKLLSFANTPYNHNAIHTKTNSHIANNNKVEDSSFDPVQYGHSKTHSSLGNIFRRPNKL